MSNRRSRQSVSQHEHEGVIYCPGDAVLLKKDIKGIIKDIQETRLGMTALVHEFTDQETLTIMEFRGKKKKITEAIAENELLYNTGKAKEVSFKEFVHKVEISNKESSQYFCRAALDIDRGHILKVDWKVVERGQDFIVSSPIKSSPSSGRMTRKSRVAIVVDDDTAVNSDDGSVSHKEAKQTCDEEFQEEKEESVQSVAEESDDIESESSQESISVQEESDSDDVKERSRKPRSKRSRMDKIRASAKPIIKKQYKFGINDVNLISKNSSSATVYQKARDRLYLSYTPDSLPCREKEFDEIYMFLEELIDARSGACVYISGVPGTGKTATVYSVMNAFQKLMQSKVSLFELKFRKYHNVSSLK
jgi:hypothetical protein